MRCSILAFERKENKESKEGLSNGHEDKTARHKYTAGSSGRTKSVDLAGQSSIEYYSEMSTLWNTL